MPKNDLHPAAATGSKPWFLFFSIGSPWSLECEVSIRDSHSFNLAWTMFVSSRDEATIFVAGLAALAFGTDTVVSLSDVDLLSAAEGCSYSTSTLSWR